MTKPNETIATPSREALTYRLCRTTGRWLRETAKERQARALEKDKERSGNPFVNTALGEPYRAPERTP
jgi:hypothetical protein